MVGLPDQGWASADPGPGPCPHRMLACGVKGEEGLPEGSVCQYCQSGLWRREEEARLNRTPGYSVVGSTLQLSKEKALFKLRGNEEPSYKRVDWYQYRLQPVNQKRSVEGIPGSMGSGISSGAVGMNSEKRVHQQQCEHGASGHSVRTTFLREGS